MEKNLPRILVVRKINLSRIFVSRPVTGSGWRSGQRNLRVGTNDVPTLLGSAQRVLSASHDSDPIL